MYCDVNLEGLLVVDYYLVLVGSIRGCTAAASYTPFQLLISSICCKKTVLTEIRHDMKGQYSSVFVSFSLLMTKREGGGR